VTFSDHFSDRSPQYAEFRPHYPQALFDWISEQSPSHRLAWDCATGSGQAASGLVAHFDRVIATDASAAQLRYAAPHARIQYRVALAEESGLADASVDAATVAQALHWLRLDRYFGEVERVLVPGGLFVAWGYGASRVSPEIDVVVADLYSAVVGRFWPPERALVDSHYRDVVLPFAEIHAPRFQIESLLTREQYLGYVSTWSAVRRYIAAIGKDPVAPIRATVAPLWGSPDEPRVVRWPLFVRAGRAGLRT
jgi:ubiquinone/menaquinone biosynthesis C-methylase UbiE